MCGVRACCNDMYFFRIVVVARALAFLVLNAIVVSVAISIAMFYLGSCVGVCANLRSCVLHEAFE